MFRSSFNLLPTTGRAPPPPSPPPPSQNTFPGGVRIAHAAFAACLQLVERGCDLSALSALSASVAAGAIDFDPVLERAADLLEEADHKDVDSALHAAFNDFVERQFCSSQIRQPQTASRKRARDRASLPASNHPQLVTIPFGQRNDEASAPRRKMEEFMHRFFVQGYDKSLLSERQRTVLGRIKGLFHQMMEEHLNGQSSRGRRASSSLWSNSDKPMFVNIHVVILYRYLVIMELYYTPEQVKDTLKITGCFEGYTCSDRSASDQAMKRVYSLLGPGITYYDLGIVTLSTSEFA